MKLSHFAALALSNLLATSIAFATPMSQPVDESIDMPITNTPAIASTDTNVAALNNNTSSADASSTDDSINADTQNSASSSDTNTADDLNADTATGDDDY